jgi:DNA-binding XRE family transcriptional regulator
MSATQSGDPAAAARPTAVGASRFAAATQRPPRVLAGEPAPDPARLPAHTTIVDGELLREARRRHQLSRENLAWDAGVGIETIARLERRPSVPRRCRDRTLARLAATLGEPPAALVPPEMVAALGLDGSDDAPSAGQPPQPAADSAATPMSA